ncbi:hypothetical protein [Marinomonas balearica]|uniref:Uncharacterized protein n=1 Tax=Marinomonas balearica TaxID=491947 RepID=A0A4V3CGX7_9GAMM|nr:hypothetical protein [Marinomonas balearica]TDO99472.1 hypothetical protein DFP79_0455 [Marinomonas balearica]
MTSIAVTLMLVAIGGFIAFAIYLQMKEQARLERLRKSALLGNQARQLRRYLDDLPPQYQPKDMRIWILRRLVATYDELIELQADDSLRRHRGFFIEELQQFQESKVKRKAKPVNDELQITELRRLFESFKGYLEFAKQNKKIDPDLYVRYQDLFTFYSYRVNADYHVYMARQAFLTEKFDKAIELYKEAISQLQPINENPEAKVVIDGYQEIIDEIESDLALQRQEEELAAASEEDDQAEEDLDDEWSQFMDQNTFKKKKHF